MLSENRKFSFLGEINLKRSECLKKDSLPKDDNTNWLFLKNGDKQYSFVYKFLEPLAAKYNIPFKVYLAFTMDEIENSLGLDRDYEVYRGGESVGSIKLI